MPGLRIRRLAIAAAAVIFAAAAPQARASVGDLGYLGCTGNLAGCAPTNPATALDTAGAVVITPDGKHLYAIGSSGVSHFLVDSSGNMTFAGCLGPGAGCVATNPAQALNNSGAVAGLAVTKDGRHLYVAVPNAVSHVSLDTAGNATFAGCIGPLAGCTATNPASALSGAVGIGLSPDNKHLYISSTSSNVSHFTINGTGGLTFANCAGSLAGCTPLAVASAVNTSYGLAVSPNGGHLYATSYSGSDVAHFTINSTTGNITFVGCLGAVAGCVPTNPVGAFGGATHAVVSADNGDLYTADFNAGSVAWATLDAVGNMTFQSCSGGGGCTAINPAGALNGAFRVVLSPDSTQLYAASQNSNAVSHFTIASNGAPAFANCSGSLSGCSPIAPANALAGAFGVAVHPSGAHLYVASFGGSNVSHFTIEQPPPVPTPTPTPNPPVIIASGVDNDHDGFTAGQDCNDNDSRIRPGALEIKGNRVDENCDGIAEPFPTLSSGVSTKWNVKGSKLTLTFLTISALPSKWNAEIRCSGKGCPFKKKTLKGKAKKGAASVLSSLSSKQRKFRAKQTVEVWVSAPNFNTKVARLSLKSGKIPSTTPLCVVPGGAKPQRSCS